MSVVSDRSSVLEDRSDHRRRAWGRRGLRAGVAVIGLAALSLSSAALPASAAGNTWYVSPEGSDAPGCGGSAAEACATIAAALTQVTPDDVVAIAAGSYSEALEITTPVSLQGAGPGDVTISHPGTDDVPTILVDADGEVSISGVSLTGSSSMAPGTPIVHVAPGRAATLTTVAVAGDGASSLAGVWADQDSTVAIENSTITSVGYGVTGGGTDPGAGPATVSLTTTTITATLVGVTMAAGVATIEGGSVSGEIGAGLVGASNVTFNVTGTSILDSGAPEGGTFSGGVVLQGGGTFFGDGVTISGNKNGIMLPSGGDVTLVGSTVSENISDAAGGGIYGRPGTTTGGDEIPFTLSLTDTAIERNRIGLSLDNPETVEILNSTISNNLAGIVAATQAPDATLTITDSEVLNNTGALTPGAPSYTGTGISLEGPLEVDVTNTEIDGNLTGILANYATVTITGGSISDNDWVGLFAIEEPHSELRSTVTLTGTAIERNGLDAPTAAVFGLGGIATSFFASVTGSNVTLTGNAIGATISGGTLALTDSVIRDSVISSFDDVVQVPITGHGILASGQGSEWPGQVELVRTEVSGNERDGILLSETAAGTLLTSTV
ncbi:NosD domain-containing protein, partial [Pseudactinotalea sp.]|uniref:NosD domain-containing protein n=1 Tax=Pseudactinotalea sp. TaxID=1926260 RepID=UPI003B3BCBF0